MVALERKLSGKRRAYYPCQNAQADQASGCILILMADTVLGNLAGIYSDVISNLGPRIQVSGAPLYLQQPQVRQQQNPRVVACRDQSLCSGDSWEAVAVISVFP